jgi:hypothetical protein
MSKRLLIRSGIICKLDAGNTEKMNFLPFSALKNVPLTKTKREKSSFCGKLVKNHTCLTNLKMLYALQI